MNQSPQMPSDLRLVIPPTILEMEAWFSQRWEYNPDIYLIAAASRLNVPQEQVMAWQRSLMKVTLMSTFYNDSGLDPEIPQKLSRAER